MATAEQTRLKLKNPEIIKNGFSDHLYLVDDELSTVLFLMSKLQKPLLLEGDPGVGKTDVANVLAQYLATELIRLQCYEGLDVHHAVYEWNYQKQLLSIKLREHEDVALKEKEEYIFGPDFLLKRPLLKAISKNLEAPVLLIDEIDRADEEFEAYLLELLSVYQITIPEIGTIKASQIPFVILTSNRTRELSDALKRRCLYHWIDYPDFDRELAIVQNKLPHIHKTLAHQIVAFVQEVRKLKLSRTPGIAESLDWAESLMVLDVETLDQKAVQKTLGCLVKSTDDFQIIRETSLTAVLSKSH